MMKMDSIIDDWVRRVNNSSREMLDDKDAPFSVVVGEPHGESHPQWNWEIKRYADIDWLPEMEAILPMRFPPSFRSFASRYILPEFDYGPVCFLANTPEKVAPLHELRTVILQDNDLAGVVIRSGYLPFARPVTGDFDLICFDSNTDVAEFPIVRIDHESIFMNDKICVTEKIASNFLKLIAEK